MDRKKVVRQVYLVDYVVANDRTLFNVNNLYTDQQPENYAEFIDQGNTSNWVEKFHPVYHKLTLGEADVKWMKEALKVGMHTGKFSQLYEDELGDTVSKYEHLVPPGDWFIRTDRVSLKQGMHGVGPYSDFTKIIQSMVSTSHSHACFRPTDTTCNLFFLPWLELNPNKEFRVFVYENEITGLSSQHLYSANPWLASLDDDALSEVVYKILDHFEEHIKDKMAYMGSYTMDLVVLETGVPYFIEANSFGRDYAAGSSLFHWINDDHILRAHNSPTIEVRYAVPAEPQSELLVRNEY